MNIPDKALANNICFAKALGKMFIDDLKSVKKSKRYKHRNRKYEAGVFRDPVSSRT